MNASRCHTTYPPSADVRGDIAHDVPLAMHTAWGVGGNAARVFSPADVEDLATYLQQLPSEEPVIWLGLGSNVLVRDAGVRGTVVRLGRAFAELALGKAICVDGSSFQCVHAGVAVPGAKLARYCATQGLTGAEFFAGIPGTVGGALAMNAGAFGGETWPLVRAVETIDRAGTVRRRAASEFSFDYRHLSFPGGGQQEWFISATLALAPGDESHSREAIRSLLRTRAASQPTGQRSCGSVFKNPPDDYAGRLIESAGLKGKRIGGAVVSSEHANFIINDNTASAADIERLILEVQDTVSQRSGVWLEPEVRIVGEVSQ
ncbi:MAG: UDP-N-acetylmuramate dehydrogenase [Gammaproteobacteria bacterium]